MQKTKSLMKEVKGNTKRWRDVPFLGLEESILWELIYYLKQSIESMQSDQITIDIFHRTRTKKFTSLWKHQRPQIAKVISRKKNRTGESTFLPS